MTPHPIVTLGESMMVFNGPPAAPIDRGTLLSATVAGAESNLAIALARLGHPVRWLSALGDDLFGRIIHRTLRGEGVDVSHVQFDADHPTGVMFKSRRAGAEPEVFYYRRGSACSGLNRSRLDPQTWRDASIIYLTGITAALSGGCRELVTHIMRDGRSRGIPIWFDPNDRRRLWSEDDARRTFEVLLPLVDCLSIGFSEGQMLCGSTDARQIAQAMHGYGPSLVVVKAGADGALFSDGRQELMLPSFPIPQTIDPIGAGDAFAAGLVSATLEGLAPEDRLRRAHAMGAMVCLTQGDWEGLPTRSELDRFLTQRTESAR